MSIRYVWGRYTVNTTTDTEETSVPYVRVGKPAWGERAYYVGEDYEINSAGTYDLVSPEPLNTGRYSEMLYAAFSEKNNSTIYRRHYSRTDRWVCHSYEDEETYLPDDGYEYMCATLNGSPRSFDKMTIIINQSQGNFVNNITNNKQSIYPTNGVSGSYWYVYQGSDNIDPSISYDNKQTLTKEVTISLTPSASIQYGGTITYDYQVNIDGTNWVDIGSTTATSMNYTISATATQFQARVRARDNMGFTSTTWVTGPLATVAPPYIRTRLRRKNASGTYDLIHLMTSADSVVQDDGSNVQDIINNIKQRLNLS